ncbi:hypothetical protein, partial [Rhizobium leguminosarum]|uniref:hypothetical protein n=1 Tax=Rhizobium leguminosarum TaxID=384 RepID=UPI001C941B48
RAYLCHRHLLFKGWLKQPNPLKQKQSCKSRAPNAAIAASFNPQCRLDLEVGYNRCLFDQHRIVQANENLIFLKHVTGFRFDRGNSQRIETSLDDHEITRRDASVDTGGAATTPVRAVRTVTPCLAMSSRAWRAGRETRAAEPSP